MRYLPLTKNDREEMLSTIGVDNIDELFSNIAEKVSINPKFNLPNHKTEMEVEKYLSQSANTYDLEQRMRELDQNKKTNQYYI